MHGVARDRRLPEHQLIDKGHHHKAAAEAEKRGWATSEKKTGEYLDLLKKNGMTVYAPSAQLKSDMQKVGETMLKEWLDKAGPEGKAVVDAYRK